MDRGAVEMMEPSGLRLARRRLIVKGYQALVSYGPRPMLFASPALRRLFRKTAGASSAIGSEATAACLPVRAPNNRGGAA